MIVELRTYTFHPGKLPEFLRIYEEEGLPLQRRILGRNVGYFTAETGVLNQVVHMWVYDSAGDRETRRAALNSDESWKRYLSKVLPLIQSVESKLLNPVPFFDL